MATRSFDQILSDVTAQSDPQRQVVLGQIADLPNQQAAQTSALGAQKDQAYQDITSQAQQRGLGFSGIPLGEQAKYNATTYAPALANLATSFNNQKGTLESALAGIGQNDYSNANTVYGQEQSLAEQQREFDATQALQKQQLSQPSPLASLFSPPQQQAPAPADPYASIDKNGANTAIKQLLSTNNPQTIGKTVQAITKSAGYGNIYDQYKLELLNELTKDSVYGSVLGKAAPYAVVTGKY